MWCVCVSSINFPFIFRNCGVANAITDDMCVLANNSRCMKYNADLQLPIIGIVDFEMIHVRRRRKNILFATIKSLFYLGYSNKSPTGGCMECREQLSNSRSMKMKRNSHLCFSYCVVAFFVRWACRDCAGFWLQLEQQIWLGEKVLRVFFRL